jgi:hypothetical protein
MISLTLDEDRLRLALIGQARSGDPADPVASAKGYYEWCDQLDPDGRLGWKSGHARGLARALYHVNLYEAEHGRPMVGALAINVMKGQAGGGFLTCHRDAGLPDAPDETGTGRATWRMALEESVKYWQSDHADDEQHRLSDAQFDAIMAELGKIKQMLRTLRHG